MKKLIFLLIALMLSLAALPCMGENDMLLSAAYSCSGDENGNTFRAEIGRAKDGLPILTVEENDCWTDPLTVSIYRAAEDALSRIADVVRAYRMETWSEREDYYLVLDAAHPYLYLTFMDEDGTLRRISISGYIDLSDEETDGWRAVMDILLESRNSGSLIGSYYRK